MKDIADPGRATAPHFALDASSALLHLPRRSTGRCNMRRQGRHMTPNPNTVQTGTQQGAAQGQAQPQQGQTQGSGQIGQASTGPVSPRFTDWASI